MLLALFTTTATPKKPLTPMLFYALLGPSKHLIAKHNKSNMLTFPSAKQRKAFNMSSNLDQIQIKNFGQTLLQTINNTKTPCQTSDFSSGEFVIVVVATVIERKMLRVQLITKHAISEEKWTFWS